MSRTPRWVDAVFALDRAVDEVAEVMHAARDATLFAWLDDDALGALTVSRYDAQSTYAPGGRAHARGLFSWEEEALAQLDLKPGARVLVGGAGGGREVAALRARGLDAVGFDPSEGLVTAAREALGDAMVVGDYAALVEAVTEGTGTLASRLRGQSFDAVMLGWGSLSHVLDARLREAVFVAASTLAPLLLVSAVLPPRARGRAAWVRAALAKGFRAVGAREVSEAWAMVPGTGAVVRLGLTELDALAAATGWHRVWGAEEGNARAVYARAKG